jgi:pSer/pThr/pTyr-binding forkhead associated (FHA) protein
VFDRIFGKGSKVTAARKAELRGDLAQAAELYGLAGANEEAARVMLLRGDAEPDVRRRMLYYTQAVATAPEGPVRRRARVKRAELVALTFGKMAATSSAARKDLAEAARDLEIAGEAARAAEVYRLAGDAEGEARALAAAGDVDKLEALLADQELRERTERQRHDIGARVEMLLACGRRRDALVAAESLAKLDARLAEEKAAAIRARMAKGPIVAVEIAGARVALVLGDEVVIGRTEGTLHVPSQAVSRRHLRIARENETVVVRDLGSRNGTQLRGMDLVGAIPVEGGLQLQLGREVRLGVRPSTDVPGGVEVELGGETYVAPLGRATIEPGWSIEAAADQWIELVSSSAHPAYIKDTELDARTTLLVGDEIARERSGAVVLKVLGNR